MTASDRIWKQIGELFSERSSPERTLIRLAAIWHEALSIAELCVAASGDGVIRFLPSEVDHDNDVTDVRTVTSIENWAEAVSAELHQLGLFEEHQVVAFRDGTGDAAGGLILAEELPPANADFVRCLLVLSARAVRDCDAGLHGVTRSGPDIPVDHERLESLAEFAAGAGHEINNPLGTIVGRAQLLLKDETDPDRRHALATIGGQAYRIRDMIGDVMLFGRPPEPEPQLLPLEEIIEEVLRGFEDEIVAEEFEIDVEFERGLKVFADPGQIRVVLGALLRNAIEAAHSTRSREVQVRAETLQAGTTIRISDNGRGLTGEQRRHMFDPFYSGRQAGRGLGFGLSKCWRIVSNHGGTIEVTADRDWTTFRIRFPNRD